jgi:hypothetical protein
MRSYLREMRKLKEDLTSSPCEHGRSVIVAQCGESQEEIDRRVTEYHKELAECPRCSKIAYRGPTLIVMRFGISLRLTVTSAIAVQARNIIKGKDPQDMRDTKFCAQAFAQGGGARNLRGTSSLPMQTDLLKDS